MSLDLLRRFEAGRDYTVWPIDFAMSASFEVPIGVAESLLPGKMHAIEIRPGVGLLNVSVFHFPDPPGVGEPCTEIAFNVYVFPDLSRAPAVPRMAMYTVRLSASSPAFLASTIAVDRYPVAAEPLAASLDREGAAFTARDGSGRPVVEMRGAPGMAPYRRESFFVQAFTSSEGELLHGGNVFDFDKAESQTDLDGRCALHPHPLLGPLDAGVLSEARCSLLMWSRPGSLGHEYHLINRPFTQKF
jgi:hypothetical protein